MPSNRGRRTDLSERLADAWREGRSDDFYRAAQDGLRPRVCRYLQKRGVSVHDAEDCFADVLERFFRRGELGEVDTVENPFAYLWRAAQRASTDLYRRRLAEEQHAILERERAGGRGRRRDGDHWVPTLEVSAILVEEAVEDVHAEEGWAVTVVQAAVERLSPALRRVAKVMLTYGPDYNSSEALADVGLNARTYRSGKKRCLDALKKHIPAVLGEMRIQPRYVDITVTRVRPTFPSDEEG